jgi:hypothetical protein
MSRLDRQLFSISRDAIQMEGEVVVCDLSKLIHWCLKWIVDCGFPRLCFKTLAMVYMDPEGLLDRSIGGTRPFRLR